MDSAKVLTDGAKPLEPLTEIKAAVPIGVTEVKKEVREPHHLAFTVHLKPLTVFHILF